MIIITIRAGRKALVHRTAGNSPPFLFVLLLQKEVDRERGCAVAKKILSIFVDESGDFGPYQSHCPFYLVSMVLHDQQLDLSHLIKEHDRHLADCYEPHAIHTGPLIRREKPYTSWQCEARKKLFNSLFHLARKADIHYICAGIHKRPNMDSVKMTAELSKNIAAKLRKNEAYFKSFDKIIVYYDNGQIELSKILSSVFNTLFFHVEFRLVSPIEYKLFQIADLICTMELLALKANETQLSRSEQEFFMNKRSFQKDYLKALQKKKL